MVSANMGLVEGDGADIAIETQSEPPPEEILIQSINTTAILDGCTLGSGTLCIASNVLTWTDDSKNIRFSLQYPNISLHAIKREPSTSLYLMLDHKLILPGVIIPEPLLSEEEEEEEEDSDDEYNYEEHRISEINFIPPDLTLITSLYDVMMECQALHPDPDDSFSTEDDEIYEDAYGGLADENELIENIIPEQAVENYMEELNIDCNGHGTNNGDEMECDAEVFADD